MLAASNEGLCPTCDLAMMLHNAEPTHPEPKPLNTEQPCDEGLSSGDLFALDRALVGRIKKWAAQKQSPENHLHGCDPIWFNGFCEGQIRELQNVREMLECLRSGKDIEWATPNANH